MIDPQPGLFDKYFTLDEAASLLRTVKTDLKQAKAEIAELRDAVVLKKRMMTYTNIEGNTPSEEDKASLKRLVQAYEDGIKQWLAHFQEKGIILRDLERGLIDFPYRSQKTGEEYLLCWHQQDDGLFYFHGVPDGFPGRKPITLLPE